MRIRTWTPLMVLAVWSILAADHAAALPTGTSVSGHGAIIIDPFGVPIAVMRVRLPRAGIYWIETNAPREIPGSTFR